MNYITELAAIAKENGGIIETKIAAQYGISRFMLYKLCKENKIHRIVKGQYVLPEDIQDELLSIDKRSEKIIFSHETALFLHGISDRTPFEHTVTATNESLGITTILRFFSLLYDTDLLGSIPIFLVGCLSVISLLSEVTTIHSHNIIQPYNSKSSKNIKIKIISKAS